MVDKKTAPQISLCVCFILLPIQSHPCHIYICCCLVLKGLRYWAEFQCTLYAMGFLRWMKVSVTQWSRPPIQQTQGHRLYTLYKASKTFYTDFISKFSSEDKTKINVVTAKEVIFHYKKLFADETGTKTRQHTYGLNTVYRTPRLRSMVDHVHS